MNDTPDLFDELARRADYHPAGHPQRFTGARPPCGADETDPGEARTRR